MVRGVPVNYPDVIGHVQSSLGCTTRLSSPPGAGSSRLAYFVAATGFFTSQVSADILYPF